MKEKSIPMWSCANRENEGFFPGDTYGFAVSSSTADEGKETVKTEGTMKDIDWLIQCEEWLMQIKNEERTIDDILFLISKTKHREREIVSGTAEAH